MSDRAMIEVCAEELRPGDVIEVYRVRAGLLCERHVACVEIDYDPQTDEPRRVYVTYSDRVLSEYWPDEPLALIRRADEDFPHCGPGRESGATINQDGPTAPAATPEPLPATDGVPPRPAASLLSPGVASSAAPPFREEAA